jgi:predicted glycoside hydrolase/deacetylase ChbG (UPF0249 family)
MQIIINADDFGLNADVNCGIIEAYRHGVVVSASLLVNLETSAEAARLALENRGLPVGLHFNLSSGHCVAPTAEVRALVDDEGLFQFDTQNVPASMAWLRAAIDDDHQILDQIEYEFSAQVERFQSFGLEVAHLDIHHYLSLIHIRVFEKYVELADKLAVPFRGLCYPMIDILRVPQSVVAEMNAAIRRSASLAPQISLSNLLGSKPTVIPSTGEYQRIMEARLQSLANERTQTVELVTHPARITEFVRRYDTYLWARELETALVNSLSFARFLEINRFRLISYVSLA